MFEGALMSLAQATGNHNSSLAQNIAFQNRLLGQQKAGLYQSINDSLSVENMEKDLREYLKKDEVLSE